MFLELSSGLFNKGDGQPKKLTKDQYASVIAEGVTKLLGPKESMRVEDQQRSYRARLNRVI